MFMLGSDWLWLSRWVRRWLTLRLYRRKIAFLDGKPYLREPLTALDKSIVFSVHLLILGGLAGTILGAFLGVTRLAFG
jgi:hypothetical protein